MQPSLGDNILTRLLRADLLYIQLPRYLTDDDLDSFSCVCKSWRAVRETMMEYTKAPLSIQGKVRRGRFAYYGTRSSGTEGMCCKVRDRVSKRFLAMKKARVYPLGEGVPYYMLREIEFLRGLVHPNVSRLVDIALSGKDLFMFFPYAPRTLHDAINPQLEGDAEASANPLSDGVTKRLMYQLLRGVAFCHERGVLHRNIKPKHLLLLEEDPSRESSLRAKPVPYGLDPPFEARDLETCTLCLSDFALVRTSLQPIRKYTHEVVTLWYRPPELLAGGHYVMSVDIWAVGCVFAEMVTGRPFFPGIAEIDQLFQIFSRVGTPTAESWPAFANHPNIVPMPPNDLPFFPPFPRAGLRRFFPRLEQAGVDLMEQLLDSNPEKRISARDALCSPYFNQEFLIREGYLEAPTAVMTSESTMATTILEPTMSPPQTTSMDDEAPVFTAAAADYERSVAASTSLGMQRPPRPNTFDRMERSLGMGSPRVLPSYLNLFLENERIAFQATRNESDVNANQPLGKTLADWRAMRSELVLQVLLTANNFSMCYRTPFLAVSLMDRSAGKFAMDSTMMFDDVSISCLHVSSKCEDVSYIALLDLIRFNNTQQQFLVVLDVQERILKAVQFVLASPTIVDFLHCFMFALGLDLSKTNFRDVMNLSLMMSECALVEDVFTQWLPSRVACAILMYSFLMMHSPLSKREVTALLRRLCRCQFEDVVDAFRALDCLVTTGMRNGNTIAEQSLYQRFVDVTTRRQKLEMGEFEKYLRQVQ